MCKLNGRLGVPKQPTGSRWCLNGSAPYGDSVNWYCPARFQVYVPLSSDRRVTALMAAGSQRMGRGQRFQAGTDDWDNAYKTIAVARHCVIYGFAFFASGAPWKIVSCTLW